MKSILCFLLTVILGSCSIYRKYERPEIAVSDNYRDYISRDTTSIAKLSWRELFTDSLLISMIDTALENNTDLNIARLKVNEAEAALLNARLSFAPSLGINTTGEIANFNNTTSKTYHIGALASWEIDVFGKITNAKRAAVAAFESSVAYKQAVQSQLVATVANSYYTLALIDAKLDVNNRTIESWSKSIKILEALKRAGKSNEAAVLQAKANLESLKEAQLELQKILEQTENAVYALLAKNDWGRLNRSSLIDAPFPDSLSIGLPVQLLSNRPDVVQAERNLAQAFYATNSARAAFYPSVNLSGTLGWTNNGGVIVTNPGQWLLNAIGSLTQPLFNRGTNIANLRIAKAKQEEARLLFQQSLLDAGKEVNDALSGWQTTNKQIRIADQQVNLLKEAVRKTELLMRHSPTTYLEVLTAQQSLLDAELSALQYRYNRVQSIISLYHALGGGA